MFDVELKFLMYDHDTHSSKFLVCVTNGLVSEKKIAWLDMGSFGKIYIEKSERMAEMRFEKLKEDTYKRGFVDAMREIMEYAERRI